MISRFYIWRPVHLSYLIKGKNTLPTDEMWQLADVRIIAANDQTRIHRPMIRIFPCEYEHSSDIINIYERRICKCSRCKTCIPSRLLILHNGCNTYAKFYILLLKFTYMVLICHLYHRWLLWKSECLTSLKCIWKYLYDVAICQGLNIKNAFHGIRIIHIYI